MGVSGCWVWRQVGGRTEGGVRRGCEPGVGRGGWEGGRKKPRQALEARRLRHAERTVLPAVAQSKKGRGGAGGSGESGVRREVVTAGGASGEGRGVAVPPGWRCPVRRVRGVGRGCSTDFGPELGPGAWWCVAVVGESCYRCPTTRR